MRRILATMAMSQLEQMPCVGYWRAPEQPDLPHPGDFVDASWDAEERRKVIEYLDDAYQISMFSFGPSWCRMGCAGFPKDIGTQDLTDGVWLFPEGLVHYVRHHAVRPAEAFLEHLRGRDFRHADLPTAEPGRGPVMSLGSLTMQEPPGEDHEYLLFVQCCPDPGSSLDDRAIDVALGVPGDRTRATHRWHTEVETVLLPLDAHEPDAVSASTLASRKTPGRPSTCSRPFSNPPGSWRFPERSIAGERPGRHARCCGRRMTPSLLSHFSRMSRGDEPLIRLSRCARRSDRPK
jgi:hypothetical protein